MVSLSQTLAIIRQLPHLRRSRRWLTQMRANALTALRGQGDPGLKGQSAGGGVDQAIPVTLLILSGGYRRVIPGRGDILLVENAVNSILLQSSYSNYRVLVVDDGALPAEVRKKFIRAGVAIKAYRQEGAFNYARKLNYALRLVETEDVIVLNDDIEIITPDWIEALTEHSRQARVGAVGALLIYPDNTIQHAGIVLGPGPYTRHLFHGLVVNEVKHGHGVCDCAAVTGAVLATRMSIVRELGGFDENLAIDYNDIDFCLRLEQLRYRVIYTPRAKLFHFENSSIKRRVTNLKDEAYFLSRWRDRLYSDAHGVSDTQLLRT